MNRNAFWDIIEAARSRAHSDGAGLANELRTEVKNLHPAAVISFEENLDQLIDAAFHWHLRSAAYLINGGCDDAGFDAFLCWVIVQGRETYERSEGIALSAARGLAVRSLFRALNSLVPARDELR